MNYDNFLTFYGDNLYLVGRQIKDAINEISKKENIDEFNIFYYDFEDDNFEKFLEDATTTSLFSSKKIIYIQNYTSLKSVSESHIKTFEDFVKNNSDVFFIIKASKKPTKSSQDPLSNTIFLYSKFVEVKIPEIENYKEQIAKSLKKEGFTISKENINLIFSKLNNDFARIDSEIKKLCIYKDNTKEILQEDIELCVWESIDDDIFNLIQNLFSKNKKAIIDNYNKLSQLNMKATQIIGMLFSRLSLIAMAKSLAEKRLSNDRIAEMLNVSPGRVYYLLRDAGDNNSKVFYDKINDLALLDYKIKSGEIDQEVGLELYLLGGK